MRPFECADTRARRQAHPEVDTDLCTRWHRHRGNNTELVTDLERELLLRSFPGAVCWVVLRLAHLDVEPEGSALRRCPTQRAVGCKRQLGRHHPDGGDDSFEWYVRVRIRGAILDELRAQDWLPRRARAAAEANAGTDAYVPPPSVVRIDDVSEWEQNRCLADASSSEAAVAAKFTQETLVKAVELLPERERHIVSRTTSAA